MLVLLESKSDIAQAQKKLETTFAREFRKRATRDISHPGGTRKNARVFTNGRHWYWPNHTDTTDHPNPRTLNWLGVFQPDEKFDLRIAVEANMPFEGRNDQISGFFARDGESGTIYLLHSGRVGGGAKGVGKEAFLAWRNGPLLKAVDASGKARFGAIVMAVEDAGATRSAARFIDTVARFKEAVKNGTVKTREVTKRQHELRKFLADSSGRRKGRRSGRPVDYVSRHDEIVIALSKWREARGLSNGATLAKSILVDFAVQRGREVVEVYEVKTGSGRQDMYAAIGQVLVHAASQACRRVIVVPADESLTPDVETALKRLQIEVLRFKLSATTAEIVS